MGKRRATDQLGAVLPMGADQLGSRAAIWLTLEPPSGNASAVTNLLRPGLLPLIAGAWRLPASSMGGGSAGAGWLARRADGKRSDAPVRKFSGAWAVDSSMDAASKLRRLPDLPETDADAAGSDEFKEQVRSHYDRLAAFRDSWYRRNRFYHAYIEGALRRIVPPGSAVVELGTATGNLLDSLRPARGVGVDL